MSILKPKDNTYVLPPISDTSDLFKYIAQYNGFAFYDTDPTGVTHNEIPAEKYFFANVISLGALEVGDARLRFDGTLFVAQPVDIGTDTNVSTFDVGQFEAIVKPILNHDFAMDLKNYISCDFQITITSLRPLYNSVKYTKATNCTGVEVFYSIWI